ncbi:hypothetical protein [Sebaldella sp. S0638]|uniref:hypothetical protein n=1 Tax=Sebaldella sp. S0638 TaxID=2957809 RepID=UPI0020A0D4D9|nr:hypothetical protein [Sebaldella sp. S0638]MCP1225855.1 hypothetical protein [Sebaldella sp. S0638]
MKKLPPVEKIYEAYSAISDKRIVMEENSAKVFSSDKSKEYTVTWNDDIYSSNDNASYWQGYAGYPMIAVLMLQNRISFDSSVTEFFKNINWKELNAKYKGKYSKAVDEIMEGLKNSGVDTDKIYEETDKIFEELKNLDIQCKRSSLRPPKSK